MVKIEELLKKNASVYKLVNTAAWRALELDKAEQESGTQKDPRNVLDIALDEILAGTLSCKQK